MNQIRETLYYSKPCIIEVDLEIGSNCNVCNVGAGHKLLKYNMIKRKRKEVSHDYNYNDSCLVYNVYLYSFYWFMPSILLWNDL